MKPKKNPGFPKNSKGIFGPKKSSIFLGSGPRNQRFLGRGGIKEKEEEQFYSQRIEEVIKKLDSNVKGLSNEQTKKKLEKTGFNEIPEKKALHPILVFLKQFNNALIYILVVATIISFLLHHLIDAYVIIAVMIINATIGFFQEYRAEKEIKLLKKMIVSYAKVFRNNKLIQIPARELVPGDVIFVEDGDKIPADARLLFIKNFKTTESSLTGESFPVEKEIKVLPKKTSLADRKNMIFMGTFVASGTAKAIVVSTGLETVIGKIAKDMQKIKIVKSHFEKKTNKLAIQMGIIAAIGAILTFIIGFFIRGIEFSEISLFTIASLVSGIPEGLPAVLAIVLAMGARRMAKRNAIIRKLPATETLGVVTTIITDKTGTLTENTMNVEKIVLASSKEIDISGKGWSPFGDFCESDKKINPLKSFDLSKLLHISSICNNTQLVKKGSKYEIIGDPTEASLLVLAQKSGLKKENLKEKRIDDLPFNPDLKYRASLSLLVEKGKKKEIYVVGAPEAVLKKSKYFLFNGANKKLTAKKQKEIKESINNLTDKAMRVLALAYKPVSYKTSKLSEKGVKDLIFVGVVGIRDPPRQGVKEAIDKAKQAGIRVIMTTGDHKGTALAIAKEVGLIEGSKKSKFPEVLTEEELLKLPKRKFIKVIKNVSVFARLTPSMKLKIAEVLQKKGEIVAMTGDGVNDAPAIKKADIGISMGIIGTDIARESSDMVLADDNFISIVNAIEEGRIVFTNTRNASSFLITTNFAEDATIIAALSLGLPLPLLPTQILWLNLVTDGVTDVALAVEPSHGNVIKEKPRKAKENILSKEIIPLLILMVGVMAIAALIIFKVYLPQGIEKARTGAFLIMAFTQLFNFLNMRSLKKSVFKIGLFSNKFANWALLASFVLSLAVVYLPFLQNIFNFVSLSLIDVLIIILISSSVFWLGELYKLIKGRFFDKKDEQIS